MTEGCAHIRGAHSVKRLQLEPKWEWGQNRGDSELKKKTKTPHLENLNTVLVSCTSYSARGINCATTTFTTPMALRRHHL